MINTKSNTFADSVWNFAVVSADFLMVIFKAVMFLAGMGVAAIADWWMGAISINALFGMGVPASGFLVSFQNFLSIGSLISLSASAFQLAMWQYLSKRGIGLREIWEWRLRPEEKSFVVTTLVIWLADTVSDIVPVFLIMRSDMYVNYMWVYRLMVVLVSILVLIICGFSEVLTTNMRNIFSANISLPKRNSFTSNKNRNRKNGKSNRGTTYKPNKSKSKSTNQLPSFFGGTKPVNRKAKTIKQEEFSDDGNLPSYDRKLPYYDDEEDLEFDGFDFSRLPHGHDLS